MRSTSPQDGLHRRIDLEEHRRADVELHKWANGVSHAVPTEEALLTRTESGNACNCQSCRQAGVLPSSCLVKTSSGPMHSPDLSAASGEGAVGFVWGELLRLGDLLLFLGEAEGHTLRLSLDLLLCLSAFVVFHFLSMIKNRQAIVQVQRITGVASSLLQSTCQQTA